MSPPNLTLRSAEAILLDFDGPVCNLFHGYPASRIADRERTYLHQSGVTVPEALRGPDPLKLLRWTGVSRPDLVPHVEAILIEAEISASITAAPTDGARDFMAGVVRSGRPLAIVSNNSARAIASYLSLHGLAELVTHVAGRMPGAPWLMKPDPDSVLRAAAALDVKPQTCVLVGDTPTDMEAAHRAGARGVGYAKRETRVPELSEAGADLVVRSMATLIEELL